MDAPFTKTRVRPAKDVLVRNIAGESVLLNLDNGCYFGLDDVGTRLWELLTATESVRLAYETALVEFEVAPEVLEQDLRGLIDNLVAQGLIEVSVE